MADTTISSASQMNAYLTSNYLNQSSDGMAGASASVIVSAVLQGTGDYGQAQSVEDQIKAVTQQVHNAQRQLKTDQNMVQSLQQQLNAANQSLTTAQGAAATATSSKNKDDDAKASAAVTTAQANVNKIQINLSAAQQIVANDQQVLANLQAQLLDLTQRALPAAQAADAQARRNNEQRAQAAQQQAQDAKQNAAQQSDDSAKTAAAADAAIQSSGKMLSSGAGAGAKSNIVDRTAEFTNVADGESNFNDRLLGGTAETTSAEYASTPKSSKVANGMASDNDALETSGGGARKGTQGNAPAASGLPGDGEEPPGQNAKVMALFDQAAPRGAQPGATPGTGKDKDNGAGGRGTGAPANTTGGSGTLPTNSRLTSAPAPRATGGGEMAVGAGTGTSERAPSGVPTAVTGGKVRASTAGAGASKSDASLVLPETSALGGKVAVTGRQGAASSGEGGTGNSGAGTGRDNNLKVNLTSNTVNLGGIAIPASKDVLAALGTSSAQGSGHAILAASEGNPAPMKAFLAASQPDGRTGEQTSSDIVGAYQKMTQQLGLKAPAGHTAAAGAVGAGQTAAAGGLQRITLTAGPGGAAGTVTTQRQDGVMGLSQGGGAGAAAGGSGAGSAAAAGAGGGGAKVPATSGGGPGGGKVATSVASGGDADTGTATGTGVGATGDTGLSAAMAGMPPAPAPTGAPSGGAGAPAGVAVGGGAGSGSGSTLGAGSIGVSRVSRGGPSAAMPTSGGSMGTGAAGAGRTQAATGAAAASATSATGAVATGGAAVENVMATPEARAVTLGTVKSKALGDLDPFDVSDVEHGGRSDEAFANLSPMDKVLSVMMSAANEAEGNAAAIAGQLNDATAMQQSLQQTQNSLDKAFAGQEGGDLKQQLATSSAQSEQLTQSLQSTTQSLATFVQASYNVAVANQQAKKQ